MDPKLAPFFKGREQFYPHNLETKFARIFNTVVSMWGTPELDVYFRSLFLDDRGNRRGFPDEVLNELGMLSRINEYVQKSNMAKTKDPWSDRPVRQALQIEQIEYSKEGFFRAIDIKNERAVRLFIKAGIDVETRNESDWTPLIVCASVGNLQAAQALIDAGADVNARNPQGYTALHWAAFKGYPVVAELLLSRGADINAKSSMEQTPLLQGAMCGHEEVVRLLLSRGALVNEADDEGWTPLHRAVGDGHVAVIRQLVAAGADLNAKTARGLTPAMIANQRKNQEIIAAVSG